MSIAYKKFRVYILYSSNIVVANKYNKGNNGDDNNHNYNKYGVSVMLNLPFCLNKSRFVYPGMEKLIDRGLISVLLRNVVFVFKAI